MDSDDHGKVKAILDTLRSGTSDGELGDLEMQLDQAIEVLPLLLSEDKALKASVTAIVSLLLSNDQLEKAETRFTNYIVGHWFERPRIGRATLGLLFTLRSDLAAPIFLQGAIIDDLARNLQERDLVLLSHAAASDKMCRQKIREMFYGQIQSIVAQGSVRAGLVIAKCAYATDSQQKLDEKNLQEMLRLAETAPLGDLDAVLELLSILSFDVRARSWVVSHLNMLREALESESASSRFAGLVVLLNCTTLRPLMTSEQQKLRSIQGASGKSSDEYEDDEIVLARCKIFLEKDIIKPLLCIPRPYSATVRKTLASIYFNFSKDRDMRLRLAAQGGIKTLLSIYSELEGDNATALIASHALAKVLISIDPNMAFNQRTLATEAAIRPLLFLLQHGDSSLLGIFEALLALTNLTSVNTGYGRDLVIQEAWTSIETLLISDNAKIQRATTELVCNLALSPKLAAKLVDARGKTWLRLFMILAAGADERATRLAAGGALAVLSASEKILQLIDLAAWAKAVLGMLLQGDQDMTARGLVCFENSQHSSRYGEFVKELKSTNRLSDLSASTDPTIISAMMTMKIESVDH